MDLLGYTSSMMRRRIAVVVISLTLLTGGCSSIKEKVGDLEKQALVDSIAQSVDKKLEERGLSIATLKQAVDPTGTGKIDSKTVIAETSSMAKEAALVEAKKLIDDKAKEFEATHITRDEFGREHESLLTKAILGIFGLLSTYLGKQIVSGRREAKKHANYHARMAVLEALLGQKAMKVEGDDSAPAASGDQGTPT